MPAFTSLNAIFRKRGKREAEAAILTALDNAQTGVRRTVVVSVDTSGIVTANHYALDSKALLDAIAAQSVGVAGPARTITRNADTSLTIA